MQIKATIGPSGKGTTVENKITEEDMDNKTSTMGSVTKSKFGHLAGIW